nr:MAG TPA: hypothetical protein [Caudoviricetes sp.]
MTSCQFYTHVFSPTFLDFNSNVTYYIRKTS